MFSVTRDSFKFVFLNAITFGIYGLVVMSQICCEVNAIATPRDGKHTMHYLLVTFLFSWLTLGIAPLVWRHRISDRIGKELRARGLEYEFGSSDFWLWGVLGSLIIAGPFIYLHKLLKSMNLLNRDSLLSKEIIRQKPYSAMFANGSRVQKLLNILGLKKLNGIWKYKLRHSNIPISIWLNVVVIYAIVATILG